MPPPALVFQTRVSWGNGSNDHLKPNSEKGFDDQNRRAVPECTFRFSVRNKFSWLRNKLDISLKINRILVSGPRFREILLFFGVFRRPNRKSETTLVHQFFILLQTKLSKIFRKCVGRFPKTHLHPFFFVQGKHLCIDEPSAQAWTSCFLVSLKHHTNIHVLSQRLERCWDQGGVLENFVIAFTGTRRPNPETCRLFLTMFSDLETLFRVF